MSLLVLALCVAGGLPPWETADTEVSTNCPFALEQSNVRHFRFRLDCIGTPSNNVQVAFGRDANTNGVLEISETGLAVGWDCGQWVLRGFTTNDWSVIGVTTNEAKTLEFDLSVGRGRPKRISVSENGVPFAWTLPAKLPPWMYSKDWDMLRLTVRGIDPPEESVRAEIELAGAVFFVF